jgi:hypothetical protein
MTIRQKLRYTTFALPRSCGPSQKIDLHYGDDSFRRTCDTASIDRTATRSSRGAIPGRESIGRNPSSTPFQETNCIISLTATHWRLQCRHDMSCTEYKGFVIGGEIFGVVTTL